MESFKIDIFKSENNYKSFPDFEKQSNMKCFLYREKFIDILKLGNRQIDDVEILKLVRDRSKFLADKNADSVSFNLLDLLDELQIPSTEFIYINWFRFNSIDRFKLTDLSENLKYIWYPGPDDIEIFPEDVSWIISIIGTHSAAVKSAGFFKSWHFPHFISKI